ncbi:MAG TPA: DUF6167 family protein [Acidothermaceae bacterium]|jgi:hypothetical protein|nr:DUF6167 family protein [Acidothermaceae bacterium]
MKRLLYVAIGAGVGVAAVRRVTRAAQKLTPSGLAGSAGGAISGLSDSIRGFIDDVRVGMAEREVELHDALAGEPPAPYSPSGGTTGRRNGRSAP